MTEEIIIDCAFYKDGVCASPINKTCEYCKNIDVSKCYHKQLKRLEQENKKLSFAIEKCLENAGIECDDEEQALRSLTDLGSSHYKILLEKEKYRSALEEIRGKIKYWETYFCDNCPFQNKDVCDKNEKDIGENTCTSVQLIKIQDKINECIGE